MGLDSSFAGLFLRKLSSVAVLGSPSTDLPAGAGQARWRGYAHRKHAGRNCRGIARAMGEGSTMLYGAAHAACTVRNGGPSQARRMDTELGGKDGQGQ